MKRDWKPARAKVEREGRCRRCRNTRNVEAAHIIPRSRVGPPHGDDPRNIVPLCGPFPGGCHGKQERGEFELLPLLTRDEQAYAVELVGLGEAWRRLTNE